MGLVIGRKPGESIIIGDCIKVKVIMDDSDELRLRIEAPREVEILREELHPSYTDFNIQLTEKQKKELIEKGVKFST
ncbi:carbon storage regulator [Alteribacter keqinensis]|uniref:Translational regulator CsrA n=1 Tax=Alteribacter keqinensis TaxID=2483800 RepID=A0A3M7TQ90_9BACI|nr:carbon storage regulator [Alteribacter keqinensis]RNA67728.1 carbon storage regulator [Alteribacter keqinensis]